MDPATIALHFDCKHNDRGSHLLKEDRTPVLDCEGKNVLRGVKWKDPGKKIMLIYLAWRKYFNFLSMRN